MMIGVHIAPATVICAASAIPVAVAVITETTCFICHSAPDRGAEYCNERVYVSVCVFVCPRSYLLKYTSDLHQFLYTLSVAVAHKPRLLDVATQLKRSAHAALGLAINCAQ